MSLLGKCDRLVTSKSCSHLEDLGPPADEHLNLEVARNCLVKVLKLRAMNGARHTMRMELTRKEVNSQIGASNIASPVSG